jgi:hypothetical protein
MAHVLPLNDGLTTSSARWTGGGVEGPVKPVWESPPDIICVLGIFDQ